MKRVQNAITIETADLLSRYSFELGQDSIERLLQRWLSQYPTGWVRLAVIEALYQGRYKAVSIEQILNLWQRRERMLVHFTREFEQMVCTNTPRDWAELVGRLPATVPQKNFDGEPGSTAGAKSSDAALADSALPTHAAWIAASATPTAPKWHSAELALLPPRSTETVVLPVRAASAAVGATETLGSTIPPIPPEIASARSDHALPAESVLLWQHSLIADGSRSSTAQINQFVPALERSEFYSKLKAVAQTAQQPESSGRSN